jgi:multiple sugar transport system substrate-binding protein
MNIRAGRAAVFHAATLTVLGAATIVILGGTVAGCGGPRSSSPTVLRFWAMGREGEVVQEVLADFERENPDIRVRVQQIPWSAAHEKLLTAYVGRSTPDLAQLGNTWISEFAALEALEPLDPWVASRVPIDRADYFPGIWDTNVVDGVTYGIPWYVDTRVLFYRKDALENAGFAAMPQSWDEWRAAMVAIKENAGPQRYAIFLPLNEWSPLAILGLQAGSPLLADEATRGAFREAPFRRAFAFYLDLFREGLAPSVGNNEIANVYQEFGRGLFTMYITGPWNIGEFGHRLEPQLRDSWETAPLPGPEGLASGVSLAGGSSLVLFRGSRNKEAAWRVIEFLSRPEQQLEFRRLTGDLPARRQAWTDPELSRDTHIQAFRSQLERVVSTPKVPEWELIATRLQERAEAAVRGAVSPDSALAALDRDVERILEKRRWLIERDRHRSHAGAGS